MKTTKNVFLWASYDFANSIILIVFFLYFAQWFVIEQGMSDFHYNITFTIATLFLLITVPFTGSLLDKSMRRISGLRLTTILASIFYALCALFAISENPVGAIISFTFGLYFYILSFTFYTPLLNDIAKSSKIGFVSGIGIFANYLGQITGLLIVLPFSIGALSFFDASPRAETLLPAVILFFVLSLPMLLFFNEPHKIARKTSIVSTFKETLLETRILFSFSGVGLFMLTYFLFNDAVLTASNNFSIFMEQVWNISDTTKTYILLGILVTSALGGLISGRVADKLGHKKTLMFILYGWIFLLPVIALTNNFLVFIISTTLMGFWFGSSWTVSRSVMSYLAPKGKHNLAFAYFGLVERASSFMGPIVWGLIVTNLIHLGSYRYRLATLAVTFFILLGIIAFNHVKSDRKN